MMSLFCASLNKFQNQKTCSHFGCKISETSVNSSISSNIKLSETVSAEYLSVF